MYCYLISRYPFEMESLGLAVTNVWQALSAGGQKIGAQ